MGTRRDQPYPLLCIGRRAGRLGRVSRGVAVDPLEEASEPLWMHFCFALLQETHATGLRIAKAERGHGMMQLLWPQPLWLHPPPHARGGSCRVSLALSATICLCTDHLRYLGTLPRLAVYGRNRCHTSHGQQHVLRMLGVKSAMSRCLTVAGTSS